MKSDKFYNGRQAIKEIRILSYLKKSLKTRNFSLPLSCKKLKNKLLSLKTLKIMFLRRINCKTKNSK
jgi:hypothetical protein